MSIFKWGNRHESQMSSLMNDFNSLKNNILNNGKENITNQKPTSQVYLSHHLGLNKSG